MLTPFAQGVWYDTGPVSIVGMKLTATMTVLRGEGEGLLLHSPLPLTPERRAEVESLGRVAHLYAPNTFHHRWIGEWSQAFPEAQLHAPEALAKKRPELRIDRFHDQGGAPALPGVVEELPIQGFLLSETVLVHRPSATAIVTDLVHNIGRPPERWTKIYSSAMGFYGRVALSRAIRWTAFYDRSAARRSLDELLGHPFEGLIVGHGTPIETHGRDLLAAALAWLPAATAPKLLGPTRPARWFSPKPCG